MPFEKESLNKEGHCEKCQEEINEKTIDLTIEPKELNEPNQENEELPTEMELMNKSQKQIEQNNEQMDFEEIEEIPRSRPLLSRTSNQNQIDKLHAMFMILAEKQFVATQEIRDQQRRIAILEQVTLELQNENQKLKRKLRDTQDHVKLEVSSDNEELKRTKQFRNHKTKYNNRY